MKMNKKMKRLVSVALSAAMVFSVGMTSFADEIDGLADAGSQAAVQSDFLPENIDSAGSDAAQLGADIPMLLSANLDAASGSESVTVGDVTYTFELQTEGTAVLTSVSSTDSPTSLTIPETVTSGSQTYTVTAIGTNGNTSIFSSLTAVTSICLPSGVTEIPDYAFYNCAGLTEVTAAGTVTSIGTSAFEGCKALTAIPDLSQVTKMGEKAFQQCRKLLVDVDLSSLEIIPAWAFKEASVKVTKLCSSLISIGESAFFGRGASDTLRCKFAETEADKFVFPETLESIGRCAFEYCYFPSTVVIPDSVTKLGEPEDTGAVGGQVFLSADGVQHFIVGKGVNCLWYQTFHTRFYTYEKYCILKTIDFANAEENMILMDNCLPDTNTYTWITINYGSTGSIEQNSLQNRVNEAQEGETIVLSKDEILRNTLTIPEGKNITISSEEGDTFSIYGTAETLIRVEKDATIALKNVLLSGKNGSGTILDIAGTATLGNGTVIESCVVSSSSSGAIVVNGESASLTLADGCIVRNNQVRNSYSGSIYVGDGASISIEGGSIENNEYYGSANYTCTSGVFLTSGASGIMSGGSISNNTAVRGAAIMLYSVGDGESKRVGFTMTGGEISNNKHMYFSTTNNLYPSGAVHIEGNAEFTMNGGTITGNTGTQGGGVCVVDPGLQGNGTEQKTAFVMNGGVISNNTATKSGGGIYSYSNGVYLNAGEISGNTAFMGGGVYSEGNESHYSTLHMQKVLITGNDSDGQGGGMWFCPTGSPTIYISNGGAIYGNTAGTAGDDLVIARSYNSSVDTVVSDRMLGGGQVEWYNDGAVYVPIGCYPTVAGGFPRYSAENASQTSVEEFGGSINYALKAVTVSDEEISFAQTQATLFIKGNRAVGDSVNEGFGGGVAANGGIVIGENIAEWTVNVEKKWDESVPDADWAPVTVYLKAEYADGRKYTLDKAELNKENGWQSSFAHLPDPATLGENATYTVEEQPADGFMAIYSEPVVDQDGKTISFTITNSPSDDPVIELHAYKQVNNASPEGSDFLFEVWEGDTLIKSVSNINQTVSFQFVHDCEETENHTHTYTIREVNNGLANVIYDTTSFDITVQLIKEDGGWKAEFAQGSDVTPIFSNYTSGEPEEPPTSSPEWDPSSEPEEIDDPSVPLAEPSSEPSYEEIEDSSVPLAEPSSELSYEEIEDLNVPLAEIPDEEVPLIDHTPQTSDESNLSLWLIILGASALGLVAALVFEKKNRYTPKHYR